MRACRRDPGHPGDAGRAEPAAAAGPARPGRGGDLAQRGDRARRGRRPGRLVARGAELPGGDPPPAGPGRRSTPASRSAGAACCTPGPPTLVSEAASWEHRVAALDQPDEDLAAELEQLAAAEAARGRLGLAATHLQWASDISPARADRERRLLTAALHLTLTEESRGLALREAVEATAPSALRSCVLGTMAFASGQLGEAERQFSQALDAGPGGPGRPAAVRPDRQPAGQHLHAAGTGEQVAGLRTAGAGAAARWTRRRPAAPAPWSPSAPRRCRGPRAALAELAHLEADPARVARRRRRRPVLPRACSGCWPGTWARPSAT